MDFHYSRNSTVHAAANVIRRDTQRHATEEQIHQSLLTLSAYAQVGSGEAQRDAIAALVLAFLHGLLGLDQLHHLLHAREAHVRKVISEDQGPLWGIGEKETLPNLLHAHLESADGSKPAADHLARWYCNGTAYQYLG